MPPVKKPFSGTTNLNLKDGLIRFEGTYASNPYPDGQSGLWVDTSNNLKYTQGGNTYSVLFTSPSVSPSVSPSASKSPSVSPSTSPSISPSTSPSVSPSASVSPSRSPSQSPSASVSPSISPSPA